MKSVTTRLATYFRKTHMTAIKTPICVFYLKTKKGELIGKLEHYEGEWVFQYTSDTATPFATFPDVTATYKTEQLWSIFKQGMPHKDYLGGKTDEEALKLFGQHSAISAFDLCPATF